MALIEVVYGSSWVVFDSQDAAERCLGLLHCSIRLDYHGVLDTCSENMWLLCPEERDLGICVVSFVGESGTMRGVVRQELMKRIRSGQIDVGILVFRRGFGIERHRFTEVGSKAWVNAMLGAGRMTPLFLDDSMAHVRSVQYRMGGLVVAERFLKGDRLTEKIQMFMSLS